MQINRGQAKGKPGFMICGLRALQYRSGISGKRGEGEHSINMSSDPGVVTVSAI